MATTRVFAPAKVNLTLHVTGQRTDGYHRIDSLVVFASVGDEVAIEAADDLTLRIVGPEVRGLAADRGNLVLQAARMLAADRGAAITLTKNLPVASGLGGGSADAAAALRGLPEFWGLGKPPDTGGAAIPPLARLALTLGADVPMCLSSSPVRVTGIGEVLEYQAGFPVLSAILVNPRLPVPTADVFRRLRRKDHPPMPETLPKFSGPVDLAVWLAAQRNDLEAPATELQPAIGTVIDLIAGMPKCLLARMSGSGATCFGLFPDPASATAAHDRIHRERPDFWVSAVSLENQATAALARTS